MDPFDFTPTDASQPGFAGQSPTFWQNLANFGGNMAMAANARSGNGFLTYGPGFAGPLGAAVTSTMDQSRQNALSRASIGNTQAQTQAAQLGNIATASGLPLTLARNKFLANIYQNPDLMQSLMSGQGGGTSPAASGTPPSGAAGQPDQSASASPYAASIIQKEGTGNNPMSSAAGFGQFTYQPDGSGTWNKFAAANPQYFNGMTPQQVADARKSPALGAKAVDWLAGVNAPVLQNAGVQPTGPALAMAHYLGPQGAAAVMKAPDGTPVTDVLTQSLGPQTTQRYVQANPNLAAITVAGLRSRYADVPSPGAGGAQAAGTTQSQNVLSNGTPGLGGFDPQQALAQATQYEAQANRTEMARSLGIPIPGDPAAMRQAAQQYRQAALGVLQAGPIAGATTAAQEAAKFPYAGPTAAATSQAALPAKMAANGFRIGQDGQYSVIPGGPADPAYVGAKAAAEAQAKANVELQTAGPIAAAKAENSNIDIRQGGISGVVTPQGRQWVKNPSLEEVQNPDGSISYTHITPPLPGSPEGTAGQSTPVVGPGGQAVVAKLPPNLQAARTKAYEDFTGKDTDSYIAAQNTQGWLEQMDHAADVLNQHGGFLGTGPTNPGRMAFASNVNDLLRTAGLPAAFDPSATASWEELKKATTTAGFELSSHYEGHARQAAQTIMNATSAVPSAQNSPIGFHVVSAGIREAAQQFKDAHEFKQSVYDSNGDLNQAEVQFYKNNPAQMYARRAISTVTPYNVAGDKELGRYLPGTFVSYKGKLVQVPERPGAPPIPEYLKNTAPQQQAAAAPSVPIQ